MNQKEILSSRYIDE